MRLVVVVAVAACSSHSGGKADAPPVTPDACPTLLNAPPVPIVDCDASALASIDLDGPWHMQGSATSWTLTNGSNMTSSTTAVDTTLTLQRMGCSTSIAVGSGSPTDVATNATPTALTYDCYHSDLPCRLGEITWSICVSNGVLRYRRDERQQHLEMEWGSTELDTLTR